MDKLTVENLDLYYDNFQALEKYKPQDAGQRDHGFHRPFRLRKVHSAKDPSTG